MTQFANLCNNNNASNTWTSYLNNSLDEFNWNYPLFDRELLNSMDLFQTDLLPTPDDFSRSLHDDIKQIESSGSVSPSDVSVISELEFDQPKQIEIEIRNSDCMWSGLGNLNGVLNSLKQNNNNDDAKTTEYATPIIKIKQEISDDSSNNSSDINCNNNDLENQSMKNIPPGTSLLINSRLKNNKNLKQQQTTKIPNIQTQDFLKERDQYMSLLMRPDTPISLDDDVPDFKHSVDLAACITGSNNIALDDKDYINKLKEQLEDTTMKNLDFQKITPGGNKIRNGNSLTDVLNVIGLIEMDSTSNNNKNINNISIANSITTTNSNYGTSDEETDSDECSYDETLSKNNILYSAQSQQLNIQHQPHQQHQQQQHQQQQQQQRQQKQQSMSIHHSDHSYTSCIDVVGMGLETPSDSDEEIDVVSIGDKKLPYNPSDKDRRMLQSKISARIVKTPAGIRTIPPRRRVSLEPYSQYSSGFASPSNSKSDVTRYYPTPAATPLHYTNQTTTPITNKLNSRKRQAKDENTTTPITKRQRVINKPTTAATPTTPAAAATTPTSITTPNNKNLNYKNSPAKQRNYDADSDTIEKRNLHNDMERQRRIGLKNLFEALKKQIPSIKDKERAPKVNILREAAKLCDQYARDEKLLLQQRMQLMNELQKREQLLLQMQRSRKDLIA